MLQRDPKRRASLEEIENHPWLQGVDPSPATKYNIPLVSYKNLSEEEHNSIIQRMVLGDIADRDAIVEYVSVSREGSTGFALGFLEWALFATDRTRGHSQTHSWVISFASPSSWLIVL